MQNVARSSVVTLKKVLYSFTLLAAIGAPVALSGCGSAEETTLDQDSADIDQDTGALRPVSIDGVSCNELRKQIRAALLAEGALTGCFLAKEIKQQLFDQGCAKKPPQAEQCIEEEEVVQAEEPAVPEAP